MFVVICVGSDLYEGQIIQLEASYRVCVCETSTVRRARPKLGCSAIDKKKLNFILYCWPGSSVGIVTGYGLDGPGSDPGGDEIFPPVQTLGPTQPPVKWVPSLSRG